jgi:uncharacterized RDD family membrane protein YckC
MHNDISQARPPGLLRRLAALLYDGLLLFGILLLATGLVVVPYGQLVGPEFPSHAWWFRAWLVATVVGFYAYFWTHGGQTLGMNAWRLRLMRADGASLRLADALLRLACVALYLMPATAVYLIDRVWGMPSITGWIGWTLTLAPAMLGLLWVLVDPDGLAWHDRCSRTRLVLVARQR